MGGPGLGLGYQQGDGHVDGGAVHGLPALDPAVVLHDDDGGALDRGGLGVRDGEAVHHAGRALVLALEEGDHELVGVVGDAELDRFVAHEGERVVAAGQIKAEENVVGRDEVLDLGGLGGGARRRSGGHRRARGRHRAARPRRARPGRPRKPAGREPTHAS